LSIEQPLKGNSEIIGNGIVAARATGVHAKPISNQSAERTKRRKSSWARGVSKRRKQKVRLLS